MFNALHIFKFEIGITTCYTKYFLNSTLKSIYNSQSLYTKRYLDSSCFRSSTKTIVPLVIREGSSNNTNLKERKAYIENKMTRNTKHRKKTYLLKVCCIICYMPSSRSPPTSHLLKVLLAYSTSSFLDALRKYAILRPNQIRAITLMVMDLIKYDRCCLYSRKS